MKTCLPLLLLAAAPAFAAPSTCPRVAEQLSEALASAKQRVGHDGEMRLEFEVDAQGQARVVSMQGPRNYRTPVRIAVDTLDCDGGTPQRYVLNIRFEEPVRALAAASPASATLAQGSSPR